MCPWYGHNCHYTPACVFLTIAFSTLRCNIFSPVSKSCSIRIVKRHQPLVASALVMQLSLPLSNHDCLPHTNCQEAVIQSDDHTHSEIAQPEVQVEMAAVEVAPSSITFVPDDDSQFYADFLVRQQTRQVVPNLAYLMDVLFCG